MMTFSLHQDKDLNSWFLRLW